MVKLGTRIAITAGLLACGVGAGGAAWAVGECQKFGTPSFTADRTVSIGGHTIQSKVAVAGGKEREEVEAGGHREIHLVSPGRMVTYDPDAGTGTVRAVRKPPPPPKGTLRIDVTPEGENKLVTVVIRDKAGAWQQLAQTTCRSDGVPLAQTFMAPINGTPVHGTMTLSNIAVGPVAPAQFEIPAGIRIKR